VVKRVTISEDMLKALIEGRAKLREDVKLRYGRYRIVERYVPVRTTHGSQSEG